MFPIWCLEDSNVNDVRIVCFELRRSKQILLLSGQQSDLSFHFRNFEFLHQTDTTYQRSCGDNKQEVSIDLRAAKRVNELKMNQILVLDLKFRSVKFKLMKSPLNLESSIVGCKIATFGA